MAVAKQTVHKGATTPAAMPAGAAKRDAQKAALDDLQAKADALSAELEVGAIDPAKLEPGSVEREVRAAINNAGEVFVKDSDPAYRYCWMYRDPNNKYGGRAVYGMEALGWERVLGDMKEARNLTAGPSRERWVADCLLMRIRTDRWAHIQLEERKRRLLQQEGIMAGLISAGDKYGVAVRDVRTDERLARLVGAPTSANVMRRIPSAAERRREFARGVAKEILSETR